MRGLDLAEHGGDLGAWANEGATQAATEKVDVSRRSEDALCKVDSETKFVQPSHDEHDVARALSDSLADNNDVVQVNCADAPDLVAE